MLPSNTRGSVPRLRVDHHALQLGKALAQLLLDPLGPSVDLAHWEIHRHVAVEDDIPAI
jgi:hypothetical protein